MSIALGLLSVMVNVDVCPLPILSGENALATVGPPSTVSVAVLLAGPAGGASLEFTPPLVLAYAPAVAEVTSMLKVQEPPALAMSPPVKRIPTSPPAVFRTPAVVPSHD